VLVVVVVVVRDCWNVREELN